MVHGAMKKNMNPRNRNNPDYARYRNAATNKYTQISHTAPVVQKLMNTTNVKDFNSAIIYPQRYTEGWGLQGEFRDNIRGSLYAHKDPGDLAQCLSAISSGSGNTQRTGNKIVCRSLNVHMIFRRSATGNTDFDTVQYGNDVGNANGDVYFSNTGAQDCVRVVIVMDNSSSGGIPNVDNVFLPGTSLIQPNRAFNDEVYTVTSHLNPNTTSRFRVLRNEVIHFNGSQFSSYQTFIDLSGLTIQYLDNNANATSIQSNGIWMFVLTTGSQNSPANAPIYSYSAKLKFVP